MNSDITADREALDHWGVCDVDRPVGIVPFPCGRYVCRNHDDRGESESTCESSVAWRPPDSDGPVGQPGGPAV
jgi:hypothetical protein